MRRGAKRDANLFSEVHWCWLNVIGFDAWIREGFKEKGWVELWILFAMKRLAMQFSEYLIQSSKQTTGFLVYVLQCTTIWKSIKGDIAYYECWRGMGGDNEKNSKGYYALLNERPNLLKWQFCDMVRYWVSSELYGLRRSHTINLTEPFI